MYVCMYMFAVVGGGVSSWWCDETRCVNLVMSQTKSYR